MSIMIQGEIENRSDTEEEVEPSCCVIESLDHYEMSELVRDHNIFLLDVRERVELLTDGKIANSVNIPPSEVRAAFSLNEKLFAAKYCRPKPTSKQVICIYCRSGPRALRVAQKLVKMGYTNLKVSAHGIKDWISHGGEAVLCVARNMHFTGLH